MKQNKIYLFLLFLICLSLANCQKSVQDQSAQSDQDVQKENRRKESLKWFLAVRSNPEGHGYIKSGYDELMKSDIIKYPNGNKEISTKKLLEKFEVYLNPTLRRVYARRLAQNNARTNTITSSNDPYYVESYSCICAGVAVPEIIRPLVDDESCTAGGGVNILEYAEDYDFENPIQWTSLVWGPEHYMYSTASGTFSPLENPYPPDVPLTVQEEFHNVIQITPDGWIRYSPI